MITLEELKDIAPRGAKNLVSNNVVDIINGLESDEGVDFADHFKQNMISMHTVLKSGEHSVTDYLNAIKFVLYKMMENSDIEAYKLAFPDRYARLLVKFNDVGSEADIRSQKISSYVSSYKANAIVVKVAEQALVPPRILNAHMFQEALNVQMNLAMNSRSDMVRTTAANSILIHLKQPDVVKMELEVGIKGQDEIQSLRDEMRRLAGAQKEAIEVGSNSPVDIAHSQLIYDIEIEE